MEAARHSEIPTGSFCYGYAFDEESGFETEEDAYAYLDSLPEKERFREFRRIFPYKDCPHFRLLEHARVECTHLGYRAVIASSDAWKKANKFYLENPDEERFDELNGGGLLGDSVKKCGLNLEGEDFSFLPTSVRSRETR